MFDYEIQTMDCRLGKRKQLHRQRRFWDFFYDMKPDVEELIFRTDFDDWYDNEFFDIAKPIMIELFGYTEEDIENV